MSEWEVNQRRNWKAQAFPYDHFVPDDTTECQYCLTEKQAEILRGIVEPLGWTTRWWSDSDTPIDRDKIEAFRDDLIRRLMMSCCGDEAPVRYRYSSDGVLQKSTDGGTTWVDAPENDPRNYSPQFPPMTGEDGSDKKCLAATGAAALLKEQVGDQLTDDMGRYTLGQLISDWVKTMIESSNPFQALVTVISNQIFALVISALRPALTDDVYGIFKCILLCHMANDASFTDAQWQAVRADITSKISGIAGVFLEHLVYLLGTAGLTNLVRAGGATTGDCSACDCACPTIWLNHQGLPSTVLLPDEGTDCQFTVASQVNTSGVSYLYFLTDADPSVLTPGFRVLTATSADAITTIGYKNLDGSVVTGHLPDPSGKVAWLFYEDEAPFTVVLTSGP